jgi:hypothetical protein
MNSSFTISEIDLCIVEYKWLITISSFIEVEGKEAQSTVIHVYDDGKYNPKIFHRNDIKYMRTVENVTRNYGKISAEMIYLL